MILIYLILILTIGGILAWVAGRFSRMASFIISLAAILIDLALIIILLFQLTDFSQDGWSEEFSAAWIPEAGIGIHLAVDGLSLLLLTLTFFIGAITVIISPGEENSRAGFFYFNILLTLAGISGVFLSADLFLFYFFWELMIVPMYFLIAIWGDDERIHSSYKFFIYTQASGLLMFIAILGLYLVHGRTTGVYSFDYRQLIGTHMSPPMEIMLMSGFLAALFVKLPAFPLHSWLPDAYTHAPMSGTIILSSLMSKTAAYGLIRFAIPLFPTASALFAPYGMALGVAGILYGAIMAISQTDMKRLIAYTSFSHMGFILVGVYAFNETAYQGVVMQMIVHGISTGALFVMAELLINRVRSRDITFMGGLWNEMPAAGSTALVFSMALLGLPILGNFIAEFLTLAGAFRSSIVFSSLASLGLIAATVYSLRIMKKIFFGRKINGNVYKDLTIRESLIMGILVITIVLTGIFPQPVIKTARPAIIKSLYGEKPVAMIKHLVPEKLTEKDNRHDND
jgi:NADH-quinone oxidoreductase subunit M